MDATTLTVTAGAALVGFLTAALLGKVLIPVLHRLKFGQTIREEGPAWHRAKQGTPTMGGVLFIIGSLAAALLAIIAGQFLLPVKVFSGTSLTLTKLFGGMLLALCCGAIGFVDDYIKVVKKRNLGLTASQKLFAQLLVAAGYAISVYMAGGSQLYIPFFGLVDWGVWFIPFCMFVVVAMTNATNLTDGIDGLATGVTMPVMLFFTAVACFWGQLELGIFSAGLFGGLCGFLIYNFHPAKVFMGDTGSLFLGGAVCGLAFALDIPLVLILVGIIYILETLSDILQVGYFKLTHGKRIFRMAPLHHHLELGGWSEVKLFCVFSGVTLLACVLAFLGVMGR